MSSKFSSPFLKKSPLAAGGYASGVDGMRYVSPKQPENKIVPEPKAKRPERKKLEKVSTLTPEGINIPKTEIKKVNLPNLGIINESRTITKTTKKPVEKIATTPEEKAKYNQYLADVKSGKVKRNTTYDPQTTYQDQARTGQTLDGKLEAPMSEWANVGDVYEKNKNP